MENNNLMESHKQTPKNNYKVPKKFKPILTDLIKEILINRPKDIINFCADYFKEKKEDRDYFPVDVVNIENNGAYNKFNTINKKKITTQKSTCKKDWDQQVNDPSKAIKKEENLSILECFDFKEKENILNKIKNTVNSLKNEADDYLRNEFIPNKKYIDLLISTQQAIIDFFENKGTNKENEFNKFNEDLEKKLNQLNNDFLLKDLESMEVIQAITLFKKQDYYIRMLKCYLTKIILLKRNILENNELIDEMIYFIFYPELKLALKSNNIFKKEEEMEIIGYVNNYFNNNIKLLIPDLFSFVHSCKFLDEDSIISKFSNFSIRKRDLSLVYIQQVIIPSNKELSKILTDLQLKIYISTPEQVLKSLDEAALKTEEKEEEIEPIEEKIKQNNPILSLFINKITNTPFESIDNNINEFTGLENKEREIVLKLLKLSPDYEDIYNKLNNVKINQDESNFCSTMKEIYFNMNYIPELDYMYSCIFRNELFVIPNSVKNYLNNLNNYNNSNINEEQLLKEYQNLNFLSQIGIYLYIVVKEKENKYLTGLVKKLKYIKDKYESVQHRSHLEALLQNFTHNSDEVNAFKEKYNKWKESLSKDLVEILEKNTDDEKEIIFKNVKEDLHKVIIFNILVIESLIKKDKKMMAFVDKIKKAYPSLKETK